MRVGHHRLSAPLEGGHRQPRRPERGQPEVSAAEDREHLSQDFDRRGWKFDEPVRVAVNLPRGSRHPVHIMERDGGDRRVVGVARGLDDVEQLQVLAGDREVGSAEAADGQAAGVFERLLRAHDRLRCRGGGEVVEPQVLMAVGGHLVPGLGDAPDDTGQRLGDGAQREESRLHPAPIEPGQDLVDVGRDLVPLGGASDHVCRDGEALRHPFAEPFDIDRQAVDDHRLRLGEHEVADHHRVEAVRVKAANRLQWRADDGLASHVE